MTQFTSGQKLTAKDLNEAFDSVAGPINPSKDYQWTQTNVGKIQKGWDTFIQVQNQNPETLEIGIGYSEIGSETVAEIGGKKPAAFRRVFINTGPLRTITALNIGFQDIPNIGNVDGIPFLTIVGIEYHRQSGVYLPGDGKFHFSLFSPALSPESGSTPTQWQTNQKLFQDDVERGSDSRNWWWSGFTLERHEPNPSSSVFATEPPEDIICFPMWLLYYNLQHPSLQPEMSLPILCVMLSQDYYEFKSQNFPQMSSLANLLGSRWHREGYTMNVQPSNNINLRTTLGGYVVSDTKTQNAYFRSFFNFIRMEGDTSPWCIGGFNPEKGERGFTDVRYPIIYDLDWIDDEGKQHGFSGGDVKQLSAVNLDGTPVANDQMINNLALACGWHSGMEEPVLSCVRLPLLGDLNLDDGVQSILSGLFNEEDYGLSSDMQKRLIWIDRLDTYGVQYYDTCPDFRTGETPDSDISSSCLSSIQEKEIELEVEEGEEAQSKKLWSLWGFDDFENAKDWPAQSEISGWDLVARHIHEVEGKNVGEIQYISLSAISGGNGAPGDADTTTAGLSSIQTRTLTGGEKVLQLYKFDDSETEPDTVYLSAQDRYDFVMRDNTDHCVKYAHLSGIGGEVDLSGTDGTHKKGSAFKFQSASDSNIIVSIDNNGVITIGAYYL